jgi:H+/Cl- antiporter ClcA
MLGAAVAAGVVTAFGTPIGGVIFSIEVTSTYYMVSNLWKTFFCVTCCLITFKTLHVLDFVKIFTTTNFEHYTLNYELIFAGALGLLCGFLGGIFVHVLTKIVFLRVRLKNSFVMSRWKWCLSIGLIVGLVTYPIDFMRFGDKKILNTFFSHIDLE